MKYLINERVRLCFDRKNRLIRPYWEKSRILYFNFDMNLGYKLVFLEKFTMYVQNMTTYMLKLHNCYLVFLNKGIICIATLISLCEIHLILIKHHSIVY